MHISNLEANRVGRTVFVGPKLPNLARDVVVRTLRLNQVTVGVALNFLVAMGAESAISRERQVTTVNALPVGAAVNPGDNNGGNIPGTVPGSVTSTTVTETKIETQRISYQDSQPLLRGMQAIGDERTNSITLIGSPRNIAIATNQLVQLDTRRRQVVVNVRIVDVNLLAMNDSTSSFFLRCQ
ncbi:secretin N-terminal domain-containing protein [Neosynechococcus sphagnicola]|uniref:secretin N-terminal domain-containing protein n=1 Tax=Neosynechococcus sphagnicola TaxID=1501145 RepID=UPI00138DF90A|nr:secretin N-terminal domain-containing protein [Neosynechococcus sphagnicola]